MVGNYFHVIVYTVLLIGAAVMADKPSFSYSAPAPAVVSSSYSSPSTSYSSSSSSSSSSSYSAPAPASSSYSAPATSSSSYSAPAPSSSYEAAAPVSQGNLYYYYYPVAAHPITEATPLSSDNDISPLLFLLVPLVLLLAAIPLLGLLGVSATGRSFSGRNSALDEKFGSFTELQHEVDILLHKYMVALESEECMDRVVCELGTRAQEIPSKELFFSLVEWLAPSHLLLGKERLSVFKESAMDKDFQIEACKKYRCTPPPIVEKFNPEDHPKY